MITPCTVHGRAAVPIGRGHDRGGDVPPFLETGTVAAAVAHEILVEARRATMRRGRMPLAIVVTPAIWTVLMGSQLPRAPRIAGMRLELGEESAAVAVTYRWS